MNNSIQHMLWSNLWRWRWRLGLIALLVAGSVSIGVLYGGMLQKAHSDSIEKIEPLHLQYDILVILAEKQFPRTQFETLGSYRYETQGGVYRGRTSDVPITVKEVEDVLALSLQTPFGLWEVWGVNTENRILQSEGQEILGEWPKASGDLWIPRSYQEEFHLEIGDEIPMIYVDSYGVKHNFLFKICGVGQLSFDLEKPQISLKSAQNISGESKANRQLLQVDNFKYMSNWSLFSTKMEQMYPGGVFVYEAIPQIQWQGLMKEIQSPGKWVLLLVFVFMAVSVLTISLMTFLERKQELAVLKTLGISNLQLSAILFLELFFAGLLGFSVGGLVVSSFSLLQPDYFENSGVSILQLLINNGFLTLAFFIGAVLYPLLLAKVASVNQLLYAREIPLVVTRYDHVISPTLDMIREMQEEKLHILKMTVIDGKSLSVLLKFPGEHVKAGEVVAFMSSYAGFYYQEWLAPCDGFVQSYEVSNGKYVIKPDDPSAPLHLYSGLIQSRK